MTNKLVYPYKDIEDKIIEAVDEISNPVIGTLSPKGANVIFEDERGNIQHSNDGVTIVKSIFSSDPIKNAIISVIKHASIKTNTEAGDGTTTTILLTQNLIKGGFKAIKSGMNEQDLRKHLEESGEKIIERLKDKSIKVKTDNELLQIATISANNDKFVAEKVVEVVKFAGEDGMVFIVPNNKVETEVEKEPGFMLESGMFSEELRTNPSAFSVMYKDIPVFITDKRLYYQEEAETILKVALKAGFKSIAIIAKDFIGQAPNTFIANHSKGVINVLLVKDTKNDADDLSIYLNGKVTKEKTGSLVNNITEKDFVMANQIYSDGNKTIITPKVIGHKEVTKLVTSLKNELKKDKENKELKRRIASLTAGTTTVRVGGATSIEQNETIYRFEDAVNATRAAMRDGYLVGGGVALIGSFNPSDHPEELRKILKDYTEASVRQIAKNCGKDEDSVIEKTRSGTNVNYGYNALTDTYEDLLKAGVIDPYKVTEMAVRNSISIANVILSSKFLVVTEQDNNKK